MNESMSIIRERCKNYWFSRDSMRFFRTRLPRCGFISSDGRRVYFVTRETDPSGASGYSVRYQSRDGEGAGDIGTLGNFFGYHTRASATAAAKYAARM